MATQKHMSVYKIINI